MLSSKAAWQWAGVAIMLFLFTSHAKAEEWQYSFTPYVWATNLDTTAGGSSKSANSEIDFDDLLSILDAAWMSMFEARRGNWSLMNDIVYMKISDDASVNGPLGFVAANVNARFQQGNADFFAGYTPDNSHTTFYGGLRYIYMKAETSTVVVLPLGGFAKNGSRDEDWVDPVIGFRQIWPIDNQWQATLQMDVGGGINSEFSSMNTVTLDYALTQDMNLRAGYRYARIDRDDSDLLFDQTSQGILLGAEFRF